MAEAESHPFQKQREILRAFRKAVASRTQQEKEAKQLWEAEQQDAEAVLKRALKEAEKRRDQEEARITE